MQTKLRATRTGGSNEPVDLKCSRAGDLRVAQFLPPYAMLAAAGLLFAIDIAGATAKEASAATPSTTPSWGVYNANPGGGKHIVLIQVGFATVSGTAGLGMSIVATSAIGEQTIASASYTDTDISCLDGTTKTPACYLVEDVALLGPQASWCILECATLSAVTAIGAGGVAVADGMIIAPPEGTIGLDVISPAGGTSVFDISIIIAEVQLDTA